jgi:hypothetical protein
MWPNGNYVSDNPDYNKAKEIYGELREEFEKADALYEGTIVMHCGRKGLELLREYRFIETCAVLEGRKLYAL